MTTSNDRHANAAATAAAADPRYTGGQARTERAREPGHFPGRDRGGGHGQRDGRPGGRQPQRRDDQGEEDGRAGDADHRRRAFSVSASASGDPIAP